MKVYKYLVFLLIFASCGNVDKTQDNEKKTVIVSILPQKYFVEKIAGDNFNVSVMIPPGASPVTYEPTPKQMKELSKSFAYFRIGHIEFEKSWMKNFIEVNPEMKIIDISKTADLIEPENGHDHGHFHDEHHHHGVDPHIWTSPKEVKKQVQFIYEFLVKEEPKLKEEFEINYNSFISEIDSLDQYISDQLKDFENRKFLIFHPALSYIARDYGLEQISIEIDGKEPTPSNIQQIIDLAKKENIKIVFVQKQFSTHNADVIANEIGGRVVRIDPLDYNWAESIRFITDEIVNSYSN
jgi:zinc transport system substrate-binding protein